MIVALIIISAVYTGWATVTESGALGAAVVLVLAFMHGMRTRELRDALMETARLTVMIFTLIWGIYIFVTFLNYSTVPQAFAEWIVHLPFHPYTILVCILLGYTVLGMFMDAIGMLLVTLPIFYPAMMALNGGPDATPETSPFGLTQDEASIWFGLIVVKMAEVCLITPPIGLNCFVVNGVQPQISLPDVFRGIVLFFIADIFTIAALVTCSRDRPDPAETAELSGLRARRFHHMADCPGHPFRAITTRWIMAHDGRGPDIRVHPRRHRRRRALLRAQYAGAGLRRDFRRLLRTALGRVRLGQRRRRPRSTRPSCWRWGWPGPVIGALFDRYGGRAVYVGGLPPMGTGFLVASADDRTLAWLDRPRPAGRHRRRRRPA